MLRATLLLVVALGACRAWAQGSGSGSGMVPEVLYPWGVANGDMTVVRNTSTPVTSLPVQLPGDVPLGNGLLESSRLWINTNGILTFDKPLRFLEGRLFPSGTKWLRDFVIIAPYWSATDYRGNGTVYWQLHNGGTAVANQIAMDILSYTGSRRSSYIPDFALVVTWSESSAYPDDSTHGFLGRNLFQAAIMSDGASAFAVFNYDTLSWACRAEMCPNMGYTAGLGRAFFNHPLGLTERLTTLANTTGNTGQVGRWILELSSARSSQNMASIACAEIAAAEPTRTDPPVTTLYSSVLPTFRCPSRRQQAAIVHELRPLMNYRPDAACYVFTRQTQNATATCCYSLGGVAPESLLLPNDPSAGGIVRFQPASSGLTFSSSESLYSRCAAVDPGRIFQTRPFTNTLGRSVVPDITKAAVFGSINFVTMDMLSYSFNGVGEYILLNVANSVGWTNKIQARFERLANTNVSVMTAIVCASQSGGTNASFMVSTDSNSGLLISNGTNLTQAFNELGNMSPLPAASFLVRRRNASSLLLEFENNNIVVMITSYQGQLSLELDISKTVRTSASQVEITGLLGNFNGNSSDDFLLRNRSSLPSSSSGSSIVTFAQQWQINATETEFTYYGSQSLATFAHPDLVPSTFISDTPVGGYSSTLRTACDDSLICLFEAKQTGNTAAALRSRGLSWAIANDQATLNAEAPVFQTSGRYTAYTFTANKVGYITLAVLSAQAVNISAYLNGTAAGAAVTVTLLGMTLNTSTFNVSVLLTSKYQVTLSFVARDGNNLTGVLTPTVLVCACQNGFSCSNRPIAPAMGINPFIPFRMLSCDCSEAYGGPLCESNYNGCYIDGCGRGVACTDLAAPLTGRTCGSCLSGTAVNGGVCADDDECTNGANNCGSLCVNTYRSFSCSCPNGVQSRNPTRCIESNACFSSPCGFNSSYEVCTSTGSSFVCACPAGSLSDQMTGVCTVPPPLMVSTTNIPAFAVNITLSNINLETFNIQWDVFRATIASVVNSYCTSNGGVDCDSSTARTSLTASSTMVILSDVSVNSATSGLDIVFYVQTQRRAPSPSAQSYVPPTVVVQALAMNRATLQNAGFSFQNAVEYVPPPTTTAKSKRLSAGAIAGIVISALIIIAICVVLGVLLFKNKKKRNMSVAPEDATSRQRMLSNPSPDSTSE